jgi:hypothetical protein
MIRLIIFWKYDLIWRVPPQSSGIKKESSPVFIDKDSS